jgi:hypothetical protein
LSGHESCIKLCETLIFTSQYLFPFVLEYSLLAMATLANMYVSIDEESDKRTNMLRGIQNLFKIHALENSAGGKFYGMLSSLTSVVRVRTVICVIKGSQ